MTAVIIPWRDRGDPWRKRNAVTTLDYLTQIDIAGTALVHDGRTGNAPFSRSAAYNLGIAANPDADAYVFHEADMIVPDHQLRDAIDAAAEKPGLVVPFDTYRYLSQDETARVHKGADPLDCPPEYTMANGRAVGAVNVVSAATMAAVGQWDEQFEGWGWDDRAMARAFEVATGNRTRFIPGPGIHLWHKPGWLAGERFHGGAQILAVCEVDATAANKQRYGLYGRAKTAKRVRELTAGGR